MDELASPDCYPELCAHVYYSVDRHHPNKCYSAGATVFCKTDEIWSFFEHARLTRKRIVLITGQSDFPCDEKRQEFLPPQVAHWFAPNLTHPHPCVTALPLGIGPVGDPGTAPSAELVAARRPRAARDKWLYVNFRPQTNPSVRKPIADHFRRLASQAWVTFRDPEPKGKSSIYLHEMGEHRFVLCPPGNGIDTHRTWEALATGAIPVVQRSAATEPFSHLPILFVDDHRRVDLLLLEQSWRRFVGDDSIPSECFASHWKNAFATARAAVVQKPFLSWSDFVRESLIYGLGMLKRRIQYDKS